MLVPEAKRPSSAPARQGPSGSKRTDVARVSPTRPSATKCRPPRWAMPTTCRARKARQGTT
eukprot:2484925-Lingulodinium_polyedra.AAC.1